QLGRAAGPEASSLALDDRLERAATAAGDDRSTRRLALDGGDPELLDRGEDERPGALEDLGDARVGQAAGELDRRAGEAAQVPGGGAVTDDDQRQAEAVEGLDRDVDLLVRHELGDHRVVVADRAG